jgi:hypothetical protein
LPLEQIVRIANRRGESNALDVAAGESHYTLKNREQVPSAIVSCKRVHLVDHNSPYTAEQRLVFDARCNEHHL